MVINRLLTGMILQVGDSVSKCLRDIYVHRRLPPLQKPRHDLFAVSTFVVQPFLMKFRYYSISSLPSMYGIRLPGLPTFTIKKSTIRVDKYTRPINPMGK